MCLALRVRPPWPLARPSLYGGCPSKDPPRPGDRRCPPLHRWRRPPHLGWRAAQTQRLPPDLLQAPLLPPTHPERLPTLPPRVSLGYCIVHIHHASNRPELALEMGSTNLRRDCAQRPLADGRGHVAQQLLQPRAATGAPAGALHVVRVAPGAARVPRLGLCGAPARAKATRGSAALSTTAGTHHGTEGSEAYVSLRRLGQL